MKVRLKNTHLVYFHYNPSVVNKISDISCFSIIFGILLSITVYTNTMISETILDQIQRSFSYFGKAVKVLATPILQIMKIVHCRYISNIY